MFPTIYCWHDITQQNVENSFNNFCFVMNLFIKKKEKEINE